MGESPQLRFNREKKPVVHSQFMLFGLGLVFGLALLSLGLLTGLLDLAPWMIPALMAWTAFWMTLGNPTIRLAQGIAKYVQALGINQTQVIWFSVVLMTLGGPWLFFWLWFRTEMPWLEISWYEVPAIVLVCLIGFVCLCLPLVLVVLGSITVLGTPVFTIQLLANRRKRRARHSNPS